MPARTATLIVALLLLLGTSLPIGARASDTDTELDRRFTNANQLFEKGDYQGAKTAYQSLVDDAHYSAELFFNLGNAHYRSGDPGLAALWYHRTLALDPAMSEATQNLRVIEKQTGALVIETEGLLTWIQKFPPGTFIALTTLSFWLAAIAVAIAVFSRRSRPYLPALIITASFALAVAIVGRYATSVWENQLASDNYAVITALNTSAKVNAVPEADAVIELPPGSIVRIKEKRGTWRFVRIPGNLHGWIHSDSHQPVWPPTGTVPPS